MVYRFDAAVDVARRHGDTGENRFSYSPDGKLRSAFDDGSSLPQVFGGTAWAVKYDNKTLVFLERDYRGKGPHFFAHFGYGDISTSFKMGDIKKVDSFLRGYGGRIISLKSSGDSGVYIDIDPSVQTLGYLGRRDVRVATLDDAGKFLQPFWENRDPLITSFNFTVPHPRTALGKLKERIVSSLPYMRAGDENRKWEIEVNGTYKQITVPELALTIQPVRHAVDYIVGELFGLPTLPDISEPSSK